MQLLSDELTPGAILQERYEIVQRAGGGGMGTVYQATDRRVAGRVVAIKELKQGGLDQENLKKARERFEREAAILSLVQHAHLPSVYDSFEECGRSYLVMEFVEGETLHERMKAMRRPLEPLVALNYAIQLCDVLDYLHNRHEPIIFRDLKPSNIMIRPDGQVILIDFGIARHFKPGQSGDTEAFGTLGYVAPEVGYAQSDARADIYSLGATLHHCLTNQVPDYADLNKPFPSILGINAAPPKELDELILKMVERDPAKRPANIAQVQQKLQRIQARLSAELTQLLARDTSPSLAATFYSSPTEQLHAAATSPLTSPLVSLLGRISALLLAGVGLVLPSFERTIRSWVALLVVRDTRAKIYDWYLHARLRLTATGIWTRSFLLFLAGLLLGTMIFCVEAYAQFGHSSYRVEAGLVFVLFTSIILTGNQLHAAVPRNILLCCGFFLAVAFLALLISPGFQTPSVGTGQSVMLDLLLIYGVVILALIALVGSTSIKQAATNAPAPATGRHWSASFSHFALLGLTGICLLIQFSVGAQEQIIFAPADVRPFALSLDTSFSLNNAIVCLLIAIGAISYLRAFLPVRFTGFDRFLVLLLCLLYLPAQYTFGLYEFGQMFPGLPQASAVALNLVLLAFPLLLSLLSLFPLPSHFTWIGHLPLLALTILYGWLQNALVGQEPFPLLTQSPFQVINTLPGLSPSGQIVFYALVAASLLLLMRALWFAAARATSAGDRIALFVITVGMGALQWVFWQEAQALPGFSQNTSLLYASLLSLFLGGLAICCAFASSAIAAFSALSERYGKYNWLARLLMALDRTLVLGVTIISLLLLNFFGGQGGPLAYAFAIQGLVGATVTTVLSVGLIFTIVLALFGFIALVRLRAAVGWPERVLLLLCGAVGVSLLTDPNNVQHLGIFSANTQAVAGNPFSALNLDQVVAFCILIVALLSLFWLLRTNIRSDRVPLGIIFGSAAFFALLNTLSPLPFFLLTALFLLLLGMPIAARIEQVRRGDATVPIK
ncbi:MAG TPA: serine/threonine-protein kinase [Ktedonobacteraceae bacterium]|nr:serine/threonine-protein kinase [Ktedonobacteraceae bacterium]